eukprot:COSAG02_NODE_56764_length_284_cov_0.335135_1_plen_60_part_01
MPCGRCSAVVFSPAIIKRGDSLRGEVSFTCQREAASVGRTSRAFFKQKTAYEIMSGDWSS